MGNGLSLIVNSTYLRHYRYLGFFVFYRVGREHYGLLCLQRPNTKQQTGKDTNNSLYHKYNFVDDGKSTKIIAWSTLLYIKHPPILQKKPLLCLLLNLNTMSRKEKNKGGTRLKKKAVAQMLVEMFNEHPEKDYNIKEIFAQFKASNHATKMVVMDVLDDLVLDDYVTTDGNGNYRNAIRSNVMEGTFVRKRNGRNSFVPDDGGKSILVCERNSLHALDGDRVKVTMLARRAGHTREAEVTEILERANDTFVGQLQVEQGYGFLITESRSLATDIFIPKDKLKGGKNGDKAVVKIIEWPSDSKSPIGKVIDILGKQGENNAEMHAILAQYGLPYSYPEKVENAAEKLDPGITPDEIARREDFREVTTFTIDPHDAKDFDDALSIRTLKPGVWEVGVHIADVSHYVTEGDIIDREAENGPQVYTWLTEPYPCCPKGSATLSARSGKTKRNWLTRPSLT